MYQLLLTRRYLTSKIMPLLASIAVMLCVAMELIVWSIMGGFLVMLVESGRSLIGDVAITTRHGGIAYYDDLVKRLEADEMVDAATPTIETFGMVSLPLSSEPETVMLKGVDGPTFDRVTKYRDSLWWKPLEKPLPKDRQGEDPRVQPGARAELGEYLNEGASLTAEGHAGEAGPGAAAIVIGSEVGGYNARSASGYLEPLRRRGDNLPLLLREKATISVWPIGEGGRLIAQPVTRSFPIVNQARTGLYEVDANLILVRLDALQRMLRMDAAEILPQPRAVIDPATGKERFDIPDAQGQPIIDPARVTNILVRAKEGIDAVTLQGRVAEIYEQFATDHRGGVRPPPPLGAAQVITWRDRNRTLIEAVEKETFMVMFIFGIISLTSVFLVLAIFWAMVSEKTKDIGILRAVGASRAGVAWIWLQYGLVIGIVGSLLGGAAAYAIVLNINPIHEWLGSTLGLTVWDPRIYYFTEIPNDVETWKALAVMASGLVASVAGALIPALKAAYMDPIKALRFE